MIQTVLRQIAETLPAAQNVIRRFVRTATFRRWNNGAST
jgi:hypothetical protein